MTTHELARLLLEKPDVLVLVDGEGDMVVGVLDDRCSTGSEPDVPCVIIETTSDD